MMKVLRMNLKKRKKKTLKSKLRAMEKVLKNKKKSLMRMEILSLSKSQSISKKAIITCEYLMQTSDSWKLLKLWPCRLWTPNLNSKCMLCVPVSDTVMESVPSISTLNRHGFKTPQNCLILERETTWCLPFTLSTWLDWFEELLLRNLTPSTHTSLLLTKPRNLLRKDLFKLFLRELELMLLKKWLLTMFLIHGDGKISWPSTWKWKHLKLSKTVS